MSSCMRNPRRRLSRRCVQWAHLTSTLLYACLWKGLKLYYSSLAGAQSDSEALERPIGEMQKATEHSDQWVYHGFYGRGSDVQ